MAQQREEKLRHLNEALDQWRGAQAQIWSYTAALTTLEIRLFWAARPGNLLIVCSPCVAIAGPVYWEKSHLTVGNDPSQEGLILVQDERASVRVLCRQMPLMEKGEPLCFPRTKEEELPVSGIR